jgi:hypothetical protein
MQQTNEVKTKPTYIPHPLKTAAAIEWAKDLPEALLKQTYKKHRNGSDKKIESAYAQLTSLGFNELDIDLARLNDDGLLVLAGVQATTARAKDGYAWNEASGRPEHDRRFNIKRLRAKRAEVIANLEITLKLIGINQGRSLYAGDESKRLRSEANARTEEHLKNAMVVIPTRNEVGARIGEKIIPLSVCGNTRYKSLSEFIGFVSALSTRAQEEGRKVTMISTSVPAHMHPSSPFYDGTTTPRQANRYLSKNNKAARDTLRKWHVAEAGVGTKEPHGSAVPHSHLAVFHDAYEIAEVRYNRLIESMRIPFVFSKKGKLVNQKLDEADLISFEDAEKQLLSKKLLAKNPNNPLEPDKFSPAMTREEFIEEMANDLIECAFERHFHDLERDDMTGRLVYDIGVNFKHNAEESTNGASIVSYVLTYILKSFFISIDKLPKREDFASDSEHKAANEEAIKQQVESGGDIEIRTCTAAHGIRTREMWGVPSRSPFKVIGKQHEEICDEQMETMRQTILSNKHYDYLMSQGGLNAPRKVAEFKMQSETLNSNYALRPDLLRRRVLGVARYETDPLSETGEMTQAYFHKTRIEGCFITTGKGTTDAKLKRSLAKAKVQLANAKDRDESKITSNGALVPNYPREPGSPPYRSCTAKEYAKNSQTLLH